MSFKIKIVFFSLFILVTNSYAYKDFRYGEKYCGKLNFVNISELKDFFNDSVKIIKEDTKDLDLLVCSAEVANLLWNVSSGKEDELSVSRYGYKWALLAKTIASDDPAVQYLLAVNLLMYSYSRGIVESLKNLEEVRKVSMLVYNSAPEFLEYSPAILLGALYSESPPFPIAFGNIDKAEAYFKEAIQKAPLNTTSYVFLARLYFRYNKMDEGIDVIKKVLKIPRRKHLDKIADKDLDFWWHIDQIRAINVLKSFEEGKDRHELFDIIEKAPKKLNTNNLIQALSDLKQ